MVEQVENFTGHSFKRIFVLIFILCIRLNSGIANWTGFKEGKWKDEGWSKRVCRCRMLILELSRTPSCAPFEGHGCVYSTQESQACWALSSRSPSPGPHCLGWFHSCLSTVMITYAIHPLQQTQHLSAGEGPYNAPYNTNKHDCYKKIRLQNITLCQTPVDCKFKVLAEPRAREILKFSSSSYSEGCSSTAARKNLEWKV